MASIKRIGTDKYGMPIWEAVYRIAPGKNQTRRRFHLATKAEVMRAIALDGARSGVNLKWSEATRLYIEAKLAERKSPRSMELVQRATDVFVEEMSDLAVEKTTPEILKTFMKLVVDRPVKHRFSGKQFRTSGAKVANQHRKHLLTVARYHRKHTGKVISIPFEHVPAMKVRSERRTPVPRDKVNVYLAALPPHVLRPVKLVLFYGLRSTAICNLSPVAPGADTVVAQDKNEVVRRIPIDAILADIIKGADAFRATFPNPAHRLFVTANGTAWSRMTLLHAAQRAWKRAGLEVKKIHEIRHTLGTMASRRFDRRMVQAVMGHQDEQSAAAYFHPDEEMAAEVRRKIVTELSQERRKHAEKRGESVALNYNSSGRYTCPCCGASLYMAKKKAAKR